MAWQVERGFAAGKGGCQMFVGLVGEGAGGRQSALLAMKTVGAALYPKAACRWCGALSVLWRVNHLRPVKWRWALWANGLVVQNGCCGLW